MPTLLNNSTQKALSTLARVKLYLGIGSDKYDGLLTMLLNDATGFIERFCKRSFLSQTYTSEVYDGSGTDTIVLNQFPVTAVSAFQYRDYEDNTDQWSSFDSTDEFRWFEDGRIQLIAGKFSETPKKYRVTYVAGYKIDFDNENNPSLHTLPFEIEAACLKIVGAVFNTRRLEGLESESIGDSSVKVKMAVFNDPEIKGILEKYVAPTI